MIFLGYKIAIIGTGYMAKKHCDAMSDSSKIVLDTIVSTEKSTAEAEEFRQKFGFKKTCNNSNKSI